MQESDSALSHQLQRLGLLSAGQHVASLDSASFQSLLLKYLKARGIEVPQNRPAYVTAAHIQKELTVITGSSIQLDVLLSFSLQKARPLLFTILAAQAEEQPAPQKKAEERSVRGYVHHRLRRMDKFHGLRGVDFGMAEVEEMEAQKVEDCDLPYFCYCRVLDSRLDQLAQTFNRRPAQLTKTQKALLGSFASTVVQAPIKKSEQKQKQKQKQKAEQSITEDQQALSQKPAQEKRVSQQQLLEAQISQLEQRKGQLQQDLLEFEQRAAQLDLRIGQQKKEAVSLQRSIQTDKQILASLTAKPAKQSPRQALAQITVLGDQSLAQLTLEISNYKQSCQESLEKHQQLKKKSRDIEAEYFKAAEQVAAIQLQLQNRTEPGAGGLPRSVFVKRIGEVQEAWASSRRELAGVVKELAVLESRSGELIKSVGSTQSEIDSLLNFQKKEDQHLSSIREIYGMYKQALKNIVFLLEQNIRNKKLAKELEMQLGQLQAKNFASQIGRLKGILQQMKGA